MTHRDKPISFFRPLPREEWERTREQQIAGGLLPPDATYDDYLAALRRASYGLDPWKKPEQPIIGDFEDLLALDPKQVASIKVLTKEEQDELLLSMKRATDLIQ
jgi:hypothetical protein